ncbi:MAG TPA: glycosyltransferase family 2 protein [Phaeodactylibacter sp.]|nr:glycosyltransferase family 2 protein [Phaeodactylibacter sp.]
MKKPAVSILIPCFNEEDFIEAVIQNILEQDYPQSQMEVLFLDGMSTDRTAGIITQYADNQPFIKLIPNPEQYVPQAMNLGIQQATGEIIIRLDAHATYPKQYISQLVFWLKKLNAENVGGIWNIQPRNYSLKAKAIVKVLSHPIGVGNALYRMGVSEPQEVDTVPFGCYPKSVFEKYGLYDTNLQRNQDIELNKRIKRKGGKIFLVPDVECTYFARSSFRSLWKNNYANGKWVILTAWFTKTFDSLSLRHFVPLFFFGYVLVALAALLYIFVSGFSWVAGMFILPLVAYFSILLFFSTKISLEEKNIKLIPYLIASFFTLHLSYGVGSVVGIGSLVIEN